MTDGIQSVGLLTNKAIVGNNFVAGSPVQAYWTLVSRSRADCGADMTSSIEPEMHNVSQHH